MKKRAIALATISLLGAVTFSGCSNQKNPAKKNNSNVASESTGTVKYTDSTIKELNYSNAKLTDKKYRISKFSEGYATIYDFSNGKWGLIDINGNIVADTVYNIIGEFSEGLAYYTIYDYSNMDKSERGFINGKGEKVLKVSGFSKKFCEGVAVISSDYSRDRSIIDKTGKVLAVIKDESTPDTCFTNDRISVGVTGPGYSFYDKTGKVTTKEKYVLVRDYFGNYAIVKKDYDGDLWGVIDKDGNVVLDYKYNSISYTNTEGQFIVDSSKIVDKNGNTIKELPKYRSLSGNKNSDLIIVQKSTDKSYRFGFINYNGDVVIDPIYEDLEFFSEGLAVAKYNGKYGYIDTNGNVVIDFMFDKAEDFNGGYASVSYNTGSSDYYSYIIDTKGNVIFGTKK